MGPISNGEYQGRTGDLPDVHRDAQTGWLNLQKVLLVFQSIKKRSCK
jgi:hypothetical protein